MSALKTARESISEVLETAELTAHPYLPGRITPPVAVVQAGTPYLADGPAFGHFLGRWEVIVIAPTGANDVVPDELDSLIEDAVVALVNSGYGVESVGQPYALEANNAQYAAVNITITHEIAL